jgi:hypothetical protein
MGAWYPPIVAVQAAGVCWGQVTLDDQVDQGSRSAGSLGERDERPENLVDHRARLAHGGDGRGRQRDGLTMPGGRDDLRNSQVTSIKHDRH